MSVTFSNGSLATGQHLLVTVHYSLWCGGKLALPERGKVMGETNKSLLFGGLFLFVINYFKEYKQKRWQKLIIEQQRKLSADAVY